MQTPWSPVHSPPPTSPDPIAAMAEGKAKLPLPMDKEKFTKSDLMTMVDNLQQQLLNQSAEHEEQLAQERRRHNQLVELLVGVKSQLAVLQAGKEGELSQFGSEPAERPKQPKREESGRGGGAAVRPETLLGADPTAGLRSPSPAGSQRAPSVAPSAQSRRGSHDAAFSDGLDWHHFRFKPDESQKLAGSEGWLAWNDMLTNCLEAIGWFPDTALSHRGQAKLAAAIAAGCKGVAYAAATSHGTGMERWNRLRQLYASVGEQRSLEDVRRLKALSYKKGASASSFVTEFHAAVERARQSGMALDEILERQLFLLAVQDGAYAWVRRKQDLIQHGVSIPLPQLYEAFSQEFLAATEQQVQLSALPRGKAHAAEQSKSVAAGNGKKDWSAKRRGPQSQARDLSRDECFGCGQLGHHKSKCPSRSDSQGQRAHLAEAPEVQMNCSVSGGSEVVARILRDHQSRRAVVGSVSNYCHSAAKPDVPRQPYFLFDTGSDVHITNDARDLVDDVIEIADRTRYPIVTGGGRVYPEKLGAGRLRFVGADGKSATTFNVRNMLYIPAFPVKIFSGELFCRGGGWLDRCVLRNQRERR